MPTLVSWNLFGLEEHRLDERTEAACLALLLRPDPPDIVCLQEIVDRSLAAHLRPHFGHAGYASALQPASGEYYVGVFVRPPLQPVSAAWLPFPSSDQGRGLLQVEVQAGTHRWLVGTGHLESGPSAGPQRAAQLEACLHQLAAFDGPAVFAGDTNLRQREAREVLARHPVSDAWEALGSPTESRGTWRPTAGRGSSRWFRFDRVYGNHQVAFRSLATVTATTETEPPIPASDHLALQVELDRARS